MILSFRTDGSEKTVPTQISLIRIFTVCNTVYIFRQNSMVESLCLKFREIIVNFKRPLSLGKLWVQPEPHHEKTCLQGVRPGPSQTGLCNYRKQIRGLKFPHLKCRGTVLSVAKTKVLISCTLTTQLICTFVFAYGKIRFSHDAAHLPCIPPPMFLSGYLGVIHSQPLLLQ